MTAPNDALAQVAASFASAFGEDLAGVVGASVSARSEGSHTADRAELVGEGSALVHTRCPTGDGSGDAAHLLVTAADAGRLGALAMSGGEPQAEETALEGEVLGAFEEVMKLAAAVLGRVLEEAGGPALAAESTALLSGPAEGESLPDGRYLVLGTALELAEDRGRFRLDVALPESAGARWLGAGEAEPARGPEGESAPASDAAPADSGEVGPVVFVDPGEQDRDAAEGLEDSLGWSIWTFEPAEFRPDMLDEVTDAAAIVVAWDLGGQSGIDLVETLRADERTRDIPVLLASAAPTRSMVTTAIRTGASSFILKPYDADEVARRVRPLLGEGRR